MAIGKIYPATKQYLWGGEKLVRGYGISSSETPVAEAWMLSAHPDGDSLIAFTTENKYSFPAEVHSANEPGIQSFSAYIKAQPEVLGSLGKSFPFFPTLIKLIDAKEALSIQVHPDDSYALSKEGQYGKTEMWIVLEREKDAFLYFGFQKEYTEDEIRKAIEEENFPSLLCKVLVNPGDVFFIPAGTVHAIGSGIVLAEVQQNSNLTYRVYDYGRKDALGNTRELHVEKALKVMDRKKISDFMQEELKGLGKRKVGENAYKERIASCPYFTVERLFLEAKGCYTGQMTEESFLSILVLEGEAILKEEGKRDISEGTEQNDSSATVFEKTKQQQNANTAVEVFVKKGESFFLPAGNSQWSLRGKGQFLLTFLWADKER